MKLGKASHCWSVQLIFFIMYSVFVTVPARAQEIVEVIRVESNTVIVPANAVISAQEIQDKGATNVSEALRDVPGLELVRQGGAGQTTSLFIRGARSEDTLVLIDGIEINDALSPAGGFDFSALGVNNIERIEIFRGPRSVRFGAGALGGVINIITKAGAGPLGFGYAFEAGSLETTRAAVTARGGNERLGFSIGLESFKTSGLSAASGSSTNELDGVEIKAGSTKLSWTPTMTARVDATFRYTENETELDQFGGPAGDDPNNVSHGSQLITGIAGNEIFFQNKLKSSLGYFFTEMKRGTTNLPDTLSPTKSTDSFLSESQKVQWDNEYLINPQNRLYLQIQTRQEDGGSHSIFNGTPSSFERQKQTVTGESLSYVFESETWFADLGVRSDQSSVVGAITSSRASLGRHFEALESTLSASFGTGFKLPSLYQLYSSYGDRGLSSENSETFEIGYEQNFGRKFSGSLNYYHSHFSQMIDFDLISNKYFNLSKAQSRGLETELQYKPLANLSFVLSYTYLTTKDESTNEQLLRRPQQAGSLTMGLEDLSFKAYIRYRYRGSRIDVDPVSFARVENAAFDTTEVGGHWQFSQKLKLNLRLENIFARHYEEVLGYNSAGLVGFVGFSGEI